MVQLIPGPNDSTENGIYIGDVREVGVDVADESVDLILTDPPYLREYIYLYAWLAEFAVRVLKPDGFLLAMCGDVYLNQTFRAFDQYLHYFWLYQVHVTGNCPGIVWPHGNHKVSITVRDKHILAYSRQAGVLPRCSTIGSFVARARDKHWHKWGQDAVSFRYFCDCFSKPGDLVLDPFCGGGTTTVVCKQLGRRWLAFEIDPDAAETSRRRLAEVPMPLPGLGLSQRRLELENAP